MDLHCKCSGNWIETVDYHTIENNFKHLSMWQNSIIYNC